MAKKILVVDDEATVRLVVQEMLNSQGYGVVTASSGTECLSKAE